MPRSAEASMPVEVTFSQVRLRGRLSGVARVDLPSGDEAVAFRIVVDRPARQRGPSGRVRVDAIECVAWSALARRRLLAWAEGEVIEVDGWLQRRFWKAGAVPASRTEVVVREVRRAASESSGVTP
jgi:single-strand DNA-binding protein